MLKINFTRTVQPDQNDEKRDLWTDSNITTALCEIILTMLSKFKPLDAKNIELKKGTRFALCKPHTLGVSSVIIQRMCNVYTRVVCASNNNRLFWYKTAPANWKKKLELESGLHSAHRVPTYSFIIWKRFL